MKECVRYVMTILIAISLMAFGQVLMKDVYADEGDDFLMYVKPVKAENTAELIPDCELILSNYEDSSENITLYTETSGQYNGYFIINTSNINWFYDGIKVNVELDVETQNRINNLIQMVIREELANEIIDVCASKKGDSELADYWIGEIYIPSNCDDLDFTDEKFQYVENLDGSTLHFNDNDQMTLRVLYHAHVDTSERDDYGMAFQSDDQYHITFGVTWQLLRPVTNLLGAHRNATFQKDIDNRGGVREEFHWDPEFEVELDESEITDRGVWDVYFRIDVEITGGCFVSETWDEREVSFTVAL